MSPLPTPFLQLLLWLLAFPTAAQGTAQVPQRGPARNPHGPTTIACQSCHTFTSWSPIRSAPEFDHNRTRYPLRGMHEKVDCKQCHTKLVFTDVSTKCADCHADIHRRQFGAKCEQCHTVKGWQVSVKEIKQHQNRFPLLGAHAVLDCASCHKGAATGQFTGLPTDCGACHMASFQQAKVPDHRALGFPTTCQSCHTMDAWQGAKFEHDRFTGFTLTGAHARLECAACHVGGRFKGTPANCYGCHARDFTATRNPDHVRAGFPQDCSRCHTTISWSGARFDHSALTRFPLTGRHITTSCMQCHVGGRFAGTPRECAGCHMPEYQRTTNPNHRAAGFPTDCSLCHVTTSWPGARFDHNGRTRFPLTGAHVNATCVQCHINGRYAGTPRECAGCHMPEYERTTNPNHRAAGFPTDCSLCHSTAQWRGARFDHSRTRFPLTGAHAAQTCLSCHRDGRYSGLDTACASCHINNYNQTRNPDHRAARFPLECQVCHTTVAWTPASFDHNRTRFPLTGRHVTVACANCHIGGRYQGTPTDCYSCHSREYQSVTNPNHVAAGFPRDCTQCHTTTTWSGATFNHTWFPIYSGPHRQGVWTTCGDCHVNPQNFAIFSCLTCHAHERTRMDQHHREVRNYVYASPNCYACHPNGRH